MNAIVSHILERTQALADVEPVIALLLGAATLIVFFATLLNKPAAEPAVESGGKATGLLWNLYHGSARLVWAIVLVALLGATITVVRSYLRRTLADFQRTHGRITEANYNAVQTIWGSEQVQGELGVNIFHDEEKVDCIESEDPAKPALLRKKTVRKMVTGNPFVSAQHQVTLLQNPRKKGSAIYGGYETDCSFNWQLHNPSTTNERCTLTFPLPAADAMYDGLTATLNDQDVLPEVEIRDASLVLERDLQPDEDLDFHIGFQSRGLSSWFFQVREAREIRDFNLTLTLPDLAKARLNYPDGCMTPTTVESIDEGAGSELTYQLDHALTTKGMGVAMPQLPQPGEATRAVLNRAEDAWLMSFAVLLLSLTLARVSHAALLAGVFATATAFGYGLVADFSDLLFGFWGTALIILLPFFGVLAKFLRRAAPACGRWLPVQFLLFSVVYPCLAGLDTDRQNLYLNLCALQFLVFAVWLWLKRWLVAKHQGAGDVSLNPA